MDRTEVVTFLEGILEERGERVALADFLEEFSKRFNIVDNGSIKRKLNSLERLNMVFINKNARLVFITHKEGKIE